MKGKADASKKGEGRLKAAGGAGKRKKAAASGKPKRPPSAFFVFMSEFRQEYQAAHPDNKSVAAVSKAAGEKWRAMSEQEKAPYVDKAGQKKQDYEKTKANFDKKESTSSKKAKIHDDGEGSDKSKSEVDDDQDGGSDEENEDDEE
uniref:HMG box domain-containing protein n=1 Tax=Oryza punctata TaxID=4537 RepID=A0A0E0K3F4_ORYPU